MKKLLLLLFSTITFASFAANAHISVYIDCGNGPVLYNSIPEPMYSSRFGYIEAFFNNVTICESCKITYKITMSMEGHEEIFTYNANRAYFEDGSFEYFDYANDFSAFSGKSIKSLFTSGTSGVNGFPGVRIHFNDLNILPSSSKDNITIDNKQICKGECLDMSNIVSTLVNSNGDNVDAVSFGCSNPVTPNPRDKNINYHIECFNTVGSFPICATVKDACGEKQLQGLIVVTDCGIDLTDNDNGCKSCCEYIHSHSLDIQFSPLGLLLPDLSSQGCKGSFEVTFRNGNKVYLNSGFLSNYVFNTTEIARICYIVPCPGCDPVCYDF